MTTLAVSPATRLKLGVDSPVAVHERILEGFPIRVFSRFEKKSQLPKVAIRKVMHLPSRTLVRRKQQGRLSADESGRLYRLAGLLEAAVQLFNGDETAAVRWLCDPRPALGGRTPLDLAKTEVGAREVEALIHKLEHGVFV